MDLLSSKTELPTIQYLAYIDIVCQVRLRLYENDIALRALSFLKRCML